MLAIGNLIQCICQFDKHSLDQVKKAIWIDFWIAYLFLAVKKAIWMGHNL